jgi:hypothetical protein
MELGDLAQSSADGCGAGKRLCHGFTGNFADEATLPIMAAAPRSQPSSVVE